MKIVQIVTLIIFSFFLNLNVSAETFEYKGFIVGLPDKPDKIVIWGLNTSGQKNDFQDKFQKVFNAAYASEENPMKWYEIFDKESFTEVIIPVSGDLKKIHKEVDLSASKELTTSWLAIDQQVKTFTCYYFEGGLGITHLKNAAGDIVGVVRNSTAEDKTSWLSEGKHTLTQKGKEEENGLLGRKSRSRSSFMPYAYHVDYNEGEKGDTGIYLHRGDITGNRSKTGNSAGCNRHNGEIAKLIYGLPEGTTFRVVYK